MTRNKHILRIEALGRRDAMDPEQRRLISQHMAERVDQLTASLAGNILAGFWPIRSEIDPRFVMMALKEQGTQLALPALIDKTTMVFRTFEEATDLVAMEFGTFGPAESCKVVQPDSLLMPLAAFDKKGNRIGYGAGYYDRAIAKMHDSGHHPLLVGLAFDCQKVDAVPVEKHDIPLDMIWTESGLRIL